ncbi:TrkH family potassium uptake protein [Syntrophomonas palmitatica]|uniref:TrkH family potassium uptake protein n=1 Tax=Syntrophomonas palmitatica TaxID=402877 RepID=UPI001FA71175|nr:potassium transporter TrkG [Syntrophomonas palmitatica]
MRNLGRMILITGLAMLSCLFWSVLYREESGFGIAYATLFTIVVGFIFTKLGSQSGDMSYKESLAVVSLGWLVASVFGSLPYIITGYLPSLADAWFETVSGFTTTGASVVTDVESWPRGLLFWRSMTHWLGGMGIIALFVAIISIGVRANQLFKAEVPGPTADKISPRIRETAKSLWKTYILITAACVFSLILAGMEPFDAMCHSFATLATGGFSTKNASIAYYTNPAIHWIIILFMFLSGVNFSLHFIALRKRKFMVYWQNAEFRFYTAIALMAAAAAAISLHNTQTMPGWEKPIRDACFQVVSIMTTTGFATADYDKWPALASGVIFLMFFTGGCAGSTGGCIKPGRYIILFKRALIEVKKMIHPRAMYPLRYQGKALPEALVTNVLQFFFLYIFLLAAGMAILNAAGLDVMSSLSAAAACLGNIGPGFGLVGPTQNYAFITDGGKFTLGFLMLVGRLEIFPLLVLFLPEFWRE